MPRIVYSSTVARSKRLPSARRWSGIERKTSNSGDAIRQPPIRVVADRFRHFRSRESPTALKVQRTAQPCRYRANGVARKLTLDGGALSIADARAAAKQAAADAAKHMGPGRR